MGYTHSFTLSEEGNGDLAGIAASAPFAVDSRLPNP